MRNIGIQREIKRSVVNRHPENDATTSTFSSSDQIVDLAYVDDTHHDDVMDGPVGILTKNGYVYFVDSDGTVTWEVYLNTFLSIVDNDTNNNVNNMMVLPLVLLPILGSI